jgi:cytochrome b pre-mRNA-processing protein 3
MFQRLFGRARGVNRDVTEALYAAIVAAARQPVLYSRWEAPDTPLGRFEMLSLHMFLFQHRLRAETGAARDLAQEMIDAFFADVDHSLRELGIGDMGIPKRMKKLARMFYGRTGACAEAIERRDVAALAAALRRNVRPEDGAAWAQAEALAAYALAANDALAEQDAAAICAGRIVFPDAATLPI